MRSARLVPVLGALQVIAAVGCTGGPPPRPVPSDPPSPALPVLRDDMPYNDMPYNSLRPEALNKSCSLLSALAEGPLSSEAASRVPLDDEDAKAVMKYVVYCALDSSVTISPTGASPDGGRLGPPWRGRLALCETPANDWRTEPPSAACKDRVSSCVAALTNKVKAKVIVSLRGEPSELFPLRRRVPVSTEYRESHGRPIRSFQPCGDGTDLHSPLRNCGWAAHYVGRCQAKERIQVRVPSGALAMLRVCRGLYGCDDPRGEEPTAPPVYGGCLLESGNCAAGSPSVSFICPTNGPLVDAAGPSSGSRYGYYSVMVASLSSGTEPRPRDLPATADSGDYPASEKDVFTYREGAFYGQLFRSQCAAPPKLPPSTTDLSACYSDVWSRAEAYMANRWCAGVNCFGSTPGSCRPITEADTVVAPGVCEDELRTVGAYEKCHAPDLVSRPTWQSPITVYLNHPCDLIAGNQACEIKNGQASYIPPQ